MKRILYITSAIFLNAVTFDASAASSSAAAAMDCDEPAGILRTSTRVNASSKHVRFADQKDMETDSCDSVPASLVWDISPIKPIGSPSSLCVSSDDESTASEASVMLSRSFSPEAGCMDVENNILEAFRKFTDGTWSEAEKNHNLKASISGYDTELRTFFKGELSPTRKAVRYGIPASFIVLMMQNDMGIIEEGDITRVELSESGRYGRTSAEIREMTAAFDDVAGISRSSRALRRRD